MSKNKVEIEFVGKVNEPSLKAVGKSIANVGKGVPSAANVVNKVQKQKRDKKRQVLKDRKIRKEQAKHTKDQLKAVKKTLELEKKITAEKRKQAAIDKEAKKRPGGSGRGRGGGGLFSRIGRGAETGGAAGALCALGGAGIQALTAVASRVIGAMKSQITSGYSSYIQYGRARAGIAGMGSVSDAVLRRGEASGYSDTETVQQMRGMGRATGQLAPITGAQQIARSYGGDVSDVTQFYGTLTRAGQGFGGKAGNGGKLQMRRILSDAFKSGLDKSRAGEVLHSVASGIKSAQQATAGSVNASAISGLLTYFSRSGKSGLQGARGFQTMSALDSTIKGAGRLHGDPRVIQTMLMQSQGFGTPGGGNSYLGAMRGLEQGVFGKGGAGNLMKMVKRIQQTGGDPEQQAAILSAMTGGKLNQSVSGSVLGVVNKGGSQGNMIASIAKITEQQKPINEKLLDNSTQSLTVARRVAHLSNRLLDIGKKVQPDIEKIQDAMLSVADDLMPTALSVLHAIAESISALVQGIHSILRRLPGGDDDQDRAAAVSAANKSTAFYKKYEHGSRGARSRGAFLQEALAAQNQAQTVISANEQGLIDLNPEQLAQRTDALNVAHQSVIDARASEQQIPLSRIGSHAMRAGLGVSIRQARMNHAPINERRIRSFEESALREQYAKSHNGTSINERQLFDSMLALYEQLGAAGARNAAQMHATLDMSTYRSVISQLQPTTAPTGRVE